MILIILIFIGIYPWFIYPLILLFLPPKNNRIKISKNNIRSLKPSITVILTAYNEEENIEKKILNIYESDYPLDKLKVIMISDGSNDNTLKIANSYLEHFSSLTVVDYPRSGRAKCHNYAESIANTDILLFTDSETQFATDFISNIVKPFIDPKVGISVGKLIFRDPYNSTTAQSFKVFWRFELFLRWLEDRIGLFIFGTGACMAIRKSSYIKISSSSDIDFILTLNVAKNNLISVFQSDAIAYDYVYPSSKAEYKARVRQVSRNFHGYLDFWKLKDFIKFPFFSFVLVSHKYLRWLSPFFLLLSLISSFFVFPDYRMILFVITFFLLILILYPGKYSNLLGPLLPIYNFCLIGRAFIHGSYLAIIGSISNIYE